MEKRLIFGFAIYVLGACNLTDKQHTDALATIDSLKTNLASAYTPGFGDVMRNNIQIEHEKLWYAASESNWLLAEHSLESLESGFKNLKHWKGDDPRAKFLDMIMPSAEAVSVSLKQKDLSAFKKKYAVLTNTCNACHRSTGYQYIVIKVPTGDHYGNQEFKIK